MASSKDYLEYILDQLSELDDISYRAMMGEYIIYYRGKVVGGIYDDRFLVKPVKAAVVMMPDADMELPYYQNTELQEYVKQYGIVIESWYPLGGRGHTSEHFNNDVILGLAEKYNKSSAQIIIRWQLQAGFITIPGSSNPEHIETNYDVFDFELSEEDMHKIQELDMQERYENW